MPHDIHVNIIWYRKLTCLSTHPLPQAEELAAKAAAAAAAAKDPKAAKAAPAKGGKDPKKDAGKGGKGGAGPAETPEVPENHKLAPAKALQPTHLIQVG